MMKIKWNEYGMLLIEQDNRTMVVVSFFDMFHDVPITRLEKLTILQGIAEQALNDPDLTGERNDNQFSFNLGE